MQKPDVATWLNFFSQEKGHRHAIFACNGSPTYIGDGDNRTGGHIPVGSLYINPACSFHGFDTNAIEVEFKYKCFFKY